MAEAKTMEKKTLERMSQENFKNLKNQFDYNIDPQAVGIFILNYATIIIKNLLISRFFANVFHHLNNAEEHK